MTPKHISNDEILLWRKQCEPFQLQSLENGHSTTTFLLEEAITALWRCAQLWNFWQITAPWLRLLFCINNSEWPNWHVVTLLSECVTMILRLASTDLRCVWNTWQTSLAQGPSQKEKKQFWDNHTSSEFVPFFFFLVWYSHGEVAFRVFIFWAGKRIGEHSLVDDHIALSTIVSSFKLRQW